MSKLLGYGEDFLTLWAINEQLEIILSKFEDNTATSDCLVFYRPSFGRSGGAGSAEFGEFDAIIASRENIYLVESKWDNLTKYKKAKLELGKQQLLRHKVLAWYLVNWSKKYLGEWQRFVDDFTEPFKAFENKLPTCTRGMKKRLVTNLEFVMSKLLDHCRGFSSKVNIKNVLLFFYDSEVSTPPTEVNSDFALMPLDYGKKMKGNFIEVQFCHS